MTGKSGVARYYVVEPSIPMDDIAALILLHSQSDLQCAQHPGSQLSIDKSSISSICFVAN